jgi:hypothetical protein
MTQDALRELVTLREKATPGPWRPSIGKVGVGALAAEHRSLLLASIHGDGLVADMAFATSHADAAFIAAAGSFDFAALASAHAADSLDAAWQEAEAALPEGWSFWQMTEYSPEDGQSRRVSARVRLANVIDRRGNVPEISVSGPTLALALTALAAALRARP